MEEKRNEKRRRWRKRIVMKKDAEEKRNER